MTAIHAVRRPGRCASEKRWVATDHAERAWHKVDYELEIRSQRASEYYDWIAPLECLGEADGALCLGAPARLRASIERTCARSIGDVVREITSFRGIFLVDSEDCA